MAKIMGDNGGAKGFAMVSWILAFCGFVVLLAGIAGLQQSCGSSSPADLSARGASDLASMGAVNYLADVRCAVLYRVIVNEGFGF